jgi:2-C-methyl-D-erythritol 2,4-cyclodiphosphate synthase
VKRPPVRVGHGVDVHAFAPGRKLILGGIEIASERGLAGHSDADVITHAVCNAALGAAGLGDLGKHFPDRDPAWKDASSLELLGRVHALVREAGWRVAQVDATVMAQGPKLAPHLEKMSARLAGALEIGASCANVKAVTTERLGFVGRGEGIEAHAVVLLVPGGEG